MPDGLDDALSTTLDAYWGYYNDLVGPLTGNLDADMASYSAAYDAMTAAVTSGIDTPLTQARDAFTTAVGGVADSIAEQTARATEALTTITDKATGAIANVTTAAAAVVGTVTDKAKTAVDKVIDTAKTVVDVVVKKVTTVIDTVKTTGNVLVDKALSGIQDFISAQVGVIWEAAGSILAKTAEFIAPALAIIGDSIREVQEGLSAIPEKLGTAMVRAISGGMVDLLGLMATDLLKASPTLVATLQAAGKTSPILAELTAFTQANEGQLAGVLSSAVTSAALSTGLGQVLDQTFRPLGYGSAKLMRNTIFTPEQLIGSIYRFKGREEEFKEYLTWWGYRDEDIPDLIALSRSLFNATELSNLWMRGKLPDVELSGRLNQIGWQNEDIEHILTLSRSLFGVSELGNLWLRGLMTDEELVARLQSIGWMGEDTTYVKQLFLSIPPAADLVRMAVREAFTPEIAERFGQYEDLPPEFITYGRQVGLSEEWARRYWAAHWDLPSPQMGFEMVHRGVISQADLNLLLRALDVMPYWRDKITAISYNPYTRVDVRRMHAMGILSEADVKRSYMDGGYDDEHASKLTAWTVAYNAGIAEKAAKKDKDLTKAEVISLYRTQIIDAKECFAFLDHLGYSPEEIAYLVALADYQELIEKRDTVTNTVKLKFQKGKITYNDAVDALNKIPLSSDEIEYLLTKWEGQMPVTARFPTLAELKGFWLTKEITSAEVYDELINMGYPARWAVRYHKSIIGGAKSAK